MITRQGVPLTVLPPVRLPVHLCSPLCNPLPVQLPPPVSQRETAGLVGKPRGAAGCTPAKLHRTLTAAADDKPVRKGGQASRGGGQARRGQACQDAGQAPPQQRGQAPEPQVPNIP